MPGYFDPFGTELETGAGVDVVVRNRGLILIDDRDDRRLWRKFGTDLVSGSLAETIDLTTGGRVPADAKNVLMQVSLTKGTTGTLTGASSHNGLVCFADGDSNEFVGCGMFDFIGGDQIYDISKTGIISLVNTSLDLEWDLSSVSSYPSLAPLLAEVQVLGYFR